MKVVISTHSFLPRIGGVSTNVSILASAFADAGNEVTVVALDPGPEEGYSYRVVRNPRPRMLFKLYKQADLLILSNLAIKLIYPLLIIRRPFALRHHSESAFRLSHSPFTFDALRRVVLKRARHFMTSDYIGRKSGLTHYEVTHPFSNPHNITPDIIAPPALRSGALFVGRMEPEKGVTWLLDRWPIIQQELGVQRLKLVGSGSLDHSVRMAIANGGLPGVEQTGPLDGRETAVEMGRAAYLIVPSLWEEPFGAVGLEGVAAGAITILSNRGGLPETAQDLGFYFNPDSDEEFSRALAAAKSSFEKRCACEAESDAYDRRVAAHLAKFQPSAVARKIMKAMDATI